VTPEGSLVVVGTPIGNLGDLSPRAAEALRDADLVACEDTRRTAVLLRHAGAVTPMLPVHRHTEAARAQDLVRRMAGGARVAFVSDAGMPLVSDPGARLVSAATAAGIAVTVVPGPSAVTVALAFSGSPADEGFCFLGFPPRRGAERRALLDRLEGLAGPAVLFEAPGRTPALLAEIAARWPGRAVVLCRELTKVHEQAVRGTAAEVAAALAEAPRGEVTVVVGPGEPAAGPDDARLRHAMGLLHEAGVGAGRAAEIVAALGAATRNRAYDAAVAAAEERRRTT
jgi:16S rRNA (cytidine1402-2'-O)-methyltransferase